MRSLGVNIKKYFINPLWNGVIGFFIFLIVLMAVKLLSNFVGQETGLKPLIEDILLSMIGFVLFFLLKLLETKKGNDLK